MSNTRLDGRDVARLWAEAAAEEGPVHNDLAAGMAARLGLPAAAADWLAAVWQVFPPGPHQLLWELPATARPGIEVGDRLLRFDVPHPAVVPPVLPGARPATVLAAGTGLTAALTEADSRDRQRQTHWVVVVLPAAAFARQLTPAMLDRLHDRPSRLLVMLWSGSGQGGDPSPSAAADPVADNLLSWPGAVPRWLDGRYPAHILSELARLRQRGESAVVYVSAAESRPNAAAAVAPNGERASHAPDDRWKEALDEALRAVQHDDARVCRVTVADDARLTLDGTDDETDPAVVWAGVLAEGGRRPVVTLSAAGLAQRLEALSSLVCEPALPVTLVVHEAADGRSPSPLTQLAGLPNTGLLIPRDATELEPMVRLAVGRGRPTALLLPARQPAELISPPAPRYTLPPAELYERERDRILHSELSPLATRWTQDYAPLGSRSEYLWKWAQYGINLLTLPCLPERHRAEAADTKFLAGMMNAIVDDVADQQSNLPLLTQLLGVTRGMRPDLERVAPQDRPYLEFAGRVWDEFWRRAAEAPCFAVFEELLRYDLHQLFNALHYSHLVHENVCLINHVEYDLYAPHGLMIFSFATADLMWTPEFDARELGRLREALWHVQWMARIGNTVGTWQREIAHGDFSDGVFVQALRRGDLRIEQLLARETAAIERAIRLGNYEQHYLDRWAEHRDRLLALAPDVRSVDLRRWVGNLQRLLWSELGSRGLK